MAQTSGQFSGSIHNGYQQLIVQWTATQDITNNKSIITANMYLKSSGGLSIGTRNNTTTIDGTVKNYTSETISRGSGFNVLVGTVSQDVSHNSDGMKTFSMSSVFNIQATLGGTYYANITANSGNIELPTIPRASSITVNDANIGSATNIVINKTSSNFTTTLWYKASGQNSWTKIVDKTSNQVYGWTVPTSFYSMIPNSKTITCQFKAETYNGDTLLGTSDIVTATFTATGNPTINSFTAVDINEVTIDLTGDNTKMIKGVSTIRATVSASAQNSANISSIKVNGITAVNNKVDFNNAPTNSFEVIVTDTRGYSTSQTITMPMVNYVPLTLNPTIVRDTPTNEKINISFSGNYYNDSFGAQNNTLTVQYRYKESASSTWGSWTTISNTKNGNTYSGSTQLSNMDYQKVYNFEMRATDKIGTKPVNGITVPKGEPVYWWNEDEFHVIKKLLADSYLRADSYVSPNGRISSANLTHQYPEDKVSKKLNISSSSMSTGKPASDGFIETYFWDNSGQYDTQLFLSNSDGNRPSVRTRGGGDNWSGSWRELAWKSDVPTKTSDLTNDSNFMVSDFITVCNNATQTIKGNNTAVKYNLNTVLASSGNKLTFNSTNHEVVVGSGVSYVEASCLAYVFTRGASSNNIIYIYKNGSQVARYNHNITGDYESMTLPPIIIPVQEGDKISMYIRSSAGTNTNVVWSGSNDGQDYLTVKVIK